MGYTVYWVLAICVAILILYSLSLNATDAKASSAPITKNMKAVFVGCARDIETQVSHSLQDMIRLASEFDDYVILIYENDSSDNTADRIRDVSKQNPRVKLISEKNIPGTRTQRLAHGRNLLLTMARTTYYDFDFLVVMDMDYTRSNTDSIASIAEQMPLEYSGVTAVSRKTYYDWWAFRSSELRLDYDCHKEKHLREGEGEGEGEGGCDAWGSLWGRKLNTKLRKVESAFNGIGIYRLSNIPSEATYIGETPEGAEVCEHVAFNSHLSNLYIDPRLVTSTWDD